MMNLPNISLSIFFVENSDEFFHYLDGTWIGTWSGRRYIKPLFDIKLWNCFGRTLDDVPRTNNHIEAFHNAFNSMIQQNHPDPYKLTSYFLKEQSLTDMKIAQLNAGAKEEIYSKKGYKFINDRLKNLLADYHKMQPMEFLKNVTNNFLVRALKKAEVNQKNSDED
uniref:Uncharacterized protein n=1 Tax=Acrobeloides nanus TaxID=290746 RepID=A0A914E394_9BILA